MFAALTKSNKSELENEMTRPRKARLNKEATPVFGDLFLFQLFFRVGRSRFCQMKNSKFDYSDSHGLRFVI